MQPVAHLSFQPGAARITLGGNNVRPGKLRRPLLAVHADHGDVVDSGVCQQEALELGRRHLEPVVLDQLLDPVRDVHVEIPVDVPNVARAVPPVGIDALRSGLGVVVVALADVRALEPDFALLAHRYFRAVVHELDGHARQQISR